MLAPHCGQMSGKYAGKLVRKKSTQCMSPSWEGLQRGLGRGGGEGGHGAYLLSRATDNKKAKSSLICSGR